MAKEKEEKKDMMEEIRKADEIIHGLVFGKKEETKEEETEEPEEEPEDEEEKEETE